jgi:hypothetical protein
MMGDGCCGSQVVDMPLDNVYAGDDGAGYADASVRNGLRGDGRAIA